MGRVGRVGSAWVVLAKFWGESIRSILVGRFGRESFRPLVVSAQGRGYSQFFCLGFLVLQQQQNLGRRFGTSKMHLSPSVAKDAVRSKAVILLLLTFCLLLLPLWESVIVLCFVVRYFMSILVLQSS